MSIAKKSSAWNDLKDYAYFMFKYSKVYKIRLLFLVLFIVTFIIAGRLIPMIFGWAVDYGIKKENIDFIYICGFALIGSNALRAILSFVISFQFRYLGQDILYRVRQDLLSHVQKIRISFFDKNPSGKIVTRIANDTKSLGDLFADGLSGAFINFIEIISIIASLFFISWPMALTVVLILPPILWIAGYLSGKIRSQYILIKSKLSTINAYSAETFNGIEVIQLYGGENLAIKNFDQDVDHYKQLQLKSVSYFALLWPVIEFFQVFSILLSLIVGYYLLNHNYVTIGQIGAFILMLQGFFRPLRFILEKYNEIQNGVTSSQRIIRLFDEKIENYEVQEKDTAHLLSDTPLAIDVHKLNFSYNNKDLVLKDISFSIPRSSKTSIIGPTGSGKTTLVSMLQGFYPSAIGSIKIDNEDIHNIPMQTLRKKLLVVRQDEFIFKGTVKSNISIGSSEKEISEEDLQYILNQVGLTLDLNYKIEEMGNNLSAGEKQLIALARVLVYDPEIVIMDEATSHIDSISEKKVLAAFDKILEGRTSIVIAHRLTTVLKSDQVLVLKDGTLVETGSPETLLKDSNSLLNSFYNELL